MVNYRAPISDLRFVLKEIAEFDQVSGLEVFQNTTTDVVEAIFEEAGKLASGPIGSINQTGDQQGAVLDNGVVRTPEGFKEAYRQYFKGGWNALAFPEDIGGQALPFTIALAVNEMFAAANMAFSLCPLLTTGAVEALSAHANETLKRQYLSKLVSGEWTAAMNLTESQAGSDVGALTTRAIEQADGTYLVTGTKIYITYGDHDLADNIVHLVLARLPDAPPGTKGISLFLIPKYLVNEDGSLSERNDLQCVSLEHKLGINASPTAVMSFGDNGGAKGWLIGEKNQGMRCMFTMMNHARIGVGIEGLAVADRSFQQALRYSFDRKQGRKIGFQYKGSVAIVEHPDVRRMLMIMKSQIEAMRALVLTTGVAYDLGRHHPNNDTRLLYQGVTDLLTPVVKAWCTDLGFECASIGVQIHGGMGFIEETGAAQHLRDARIAPIYEGTNGIQALDLVSRKLLLQGGKPMNYLRNKMQHQINLLTKERDDPNFSVILESLTDSLTALEKATSWMTDSLVRDYDSAAAGASTYLRMFGTVFGGYLLAKGAVSAKRSLDNNVANSGFYQNKILTARFYAEQFLPQATALLCSVKAGSDTLFSLDIDALELS